MNSSESVSEQTMFEKLESELSVTNVVRDEVINKLLVGVRGVDVSSSAIDAEDREAFSSFVNSLGKMLNSKDSANINLVKLKLSDKQVDATNKAADAVTEFLLKVSPTIALSATREDVPDTDIEGELETVLKDKGIKITDNELKMEGTAHDKRN